MPVFLQGVFSRKVPPKALCRLPGDPDGTRARPPNRPKVRGPWGRGNSIAFGTTSGCPGDGPPEGSTFHPSSSLMRQTTAGLLFSHRHGFPITSQRRPTPMASDSDSIFITLFYAKKTLITPFLQEPPFLPVSPQTCPDHHYNNPLEADPSSLPGPLGAPCPTSPRPTPPPIPGTLRRRHRGQRGATEATRRRRRPRRRRRQ